MPAPAFISYARDDSEFALRLAQDLKGAGAPVWLDQLDIAPGESWDNAVEDALVDAPQMLLILSPSSAKSPNVRDEIAYALTCGKNIIPVLHIECIVPLRLQRKQRIDFRTDYTRGLQSLLRHILPSAPARDIPEPPFIQPPAPSASTGGEDPGLRPAEAERAHREKQEQDRREALISWAKQVVAQAEESERAAAERIHRERQEQNRRDGLVLWAQRSLAVEANKNERSEQVAEAPLLTLAAAPQVREAAAAEAAEEPGSVMVADPPPVMPAESPRAEEHSLKEDRAETVGAVAAVGLEHTFVPPADHEHASSRSGLPPQRLMALAAVLAVIAIAGTAFFVYQRTRSYSAVLKRNCDAGDNAACYNLGSYYQSQPVGKLAAAIPLFQKACDGGNANGCEALGDAYDKGRGTAADAWKAVDPYRRACDGKNMDGCDGLANLYLHSGVLGGPATSDTELIVLFRRACDGGKASSCSSLAGIYMSLSNLPKVIEFFRKGCEGGDGNGCFWLGGYYEAGKGVAKDPGQAFNLYRKACDLGDSSGCGAEAPYFLSGSSVGRDPQHAALLYQQACAGSIGESCTSLGSLYAAGDGVGQDAAKAVELFRRGCDHWNFRGCFFLAKHDESGEGTAVNPFEALTLYKKVCGGEASSAGGSVNHTDACAAAKRLQRSLER